MANPNIEFYRSRGMVLKAEVTEGVDSAPTPSANAFEVMDSKSMLESDTVERPKDRPYHTNDDFAITNVRGVIEGSVELVPPAIPGTDPAPHAPLLLPCGFAQTLIPADVGPPIVLAETVYSLISQGVPSATAWFWHAGTLRKLLGARGNLTGLTMAIGDVVKAQFRLQGSCIDVEEDDVPSDLDYDAFANARPGTTENMEMLIDDFAVMGKSHAIDLGNDLKTVEHTEARRNRINNRKGTFTLRFFRTSKADFDPWAKWRAGDIIVAQSTLIEVDDRYTQFISRGKVESVGEVDIEGDYAFEIKCRALPSSAGNDEHQLRLGQG